MSKKEKIIYLKNGHKKLINIVNFLNINKLTELDILSGWTIKEILSHIAAWNLENIQGITDILLLGKMPWWWGLPEDEFNESEIAKRKNLSLTEIINEWENSFDKMITKIENLTEDEWENHKPIPIKDFFMYEYYGLEHEGGHAKQIEEFLNKLNF